MIFFFLLTKISAKNTNNNENKNKTQTNTIHICLGICHARTQIHCRNICTFSPFSIEFMRFKFLKEKKTRNEKNESYPLIDSPSWQYFALLVPYFVFYFFFQLWMIFNAFINKNSVFVEHDSILAPFVLIRNFFFFFRTLVSSFIKRLFITVYTEI